MKMSKIKPSSIYCWNILCCKTIGIQHRNKIKRKAAVLILREIHPEYVMPVGVWQIREGIREALENPITKFESFENALSFASTFMSISNKEWIKNSKMKLNNWKPQNHVVLKF